MFYKPFKTVCHIFALAGFSFILSSCNALCCAPGYQEIKKPESLKRLEVRIELLEAYTRKDFHKVRNLYAKETRDKFRTPVEKMGNDKTDEEIQLYVKGLNEFEFNSEKQLEYDQGWNLIYNHKVRKNQYLVYTLVMEGGHYKILAERALYR